ncbi:MAG: phospholipase D-like domain-containing protein [Stackebrandtia sp.]
MSSRKTVVATAAGAAALALAVGLGAVFTPDAEAEVDSAASGCHTSGIYEVCVASPEQYDDGLDATIVDKLREYVQAAGEGDSIRGAVFEWEMDDRAPQIKGLVDDLVAAKTERGVDVKIILDDRSRNSEVIKTFDANGMVELCDGGCLPHEYDDKAGVMHMKSFTFSTGGELKVAHTSSNLTYAQLKRHENLITVNGDKKLYDSYLGFWNRMAVGSWTYDGETWDGREFNGDAQGLKSYFFPRPSGDPVPATLDNPSCEGDNDKVWVAHSLFTEHRPGTLKQLDELRSEGCDVRVILSREEDRDWVLANSDLDPDSVRLLDGKTGDPDLEWNSHHNKLIVTNALYDGKDRPAVYGGSHNLNLNELRRSSDAMLRVVDQGVYDVFADYYASMFDLAHT